MRIEITKQDIDIPRNTSGFDCPGAIAIRRHTGKICYVSYYTILFKEGEWLEYLETPKALQEFVFKWDRLQRVKPIMFEIDLEKKN